MTKKLIIIKMTIIKWRSKQGNDDFEKQNYTEVK